MSLRDSRACGAAAGAAPSVPHGGRSRREASGEGVLAGHNPVGDRDLPPPRAAELLAEHVAVRFSSARRDPKPLADFLVRAARSDQLYDLALPLREWRRTFLHRRNHGGDATNATRGRTLSERSISSPTPLEVPARRERSSPHGRGGWRRPVRPRPAPRSASAARARRGGASASSPGRPSRS